MKKLILSAAILFGTLTASATSFPAFKSVNTVNSIQEDFKEIKNEEVPEAVQTALKTAYPEATLDKAYVNSKREYKLEITVKDQKATVYADANGNWIKK